MHTTPADGNVFADLGLPDAEELRAKADLVIALTRIIRERKLTQTQAAAIAGVSQPKISALLRGKMEGFSIERLIRLLSAFGYEVLVEARPAERLAQKAPRREPETVVEAAA